MKPCLLCHIDNADEAATCAACGEGTFGASAEAVVGVAEATVTTPVQEEPAQPKKSRRQ